LNFWTIWITTEKYNMNTMHNPAHPGELLAGWLDELGSSVSAFALHIGISRVMLSRLLHGHAAISADMDLRLSEALNTSQGYWLALQTQRDLWTAKQTAKTRKRIKPFTRLTAEAEQTAV
jgi:addiction module HigA family antidote